MNLKELKNDYLTGNITKENYIIEMHVFHKLLFEYSEILKETDIKKIEITDDSVLMTSRESEIKMTCNSNDHRIIPLEILNFGYYEKEELEIISKLLKPNSYVFDIGAHIGWFSMNLAKKIKDIHILAFEPITQTFNDLEENIKMNNLSKIIKLYNFGFSNEENEVTFYYYPEGSVNASLKNLSRRLNVTKVTSKVKKLDKFAQNLPVDFIKCDVEGAELLVFNGGEKILKKNKPIIFTELLRKWSLRFNYHPQDVIKLFKNLGYGCYIIFKDKLLEIDIIDENTVETNFFFLHKEKHKKLIDNLVQDR